MKTPTDKEKIEMYEAFLHKINMYLTVMQHESVKKLLDNADKWSYAHRCGDSLSEEEQQDQINRAFWNLCQL